MKNKFHFPLIFFLILAFTLQPIKSTNAAVIPVTGNEPSAASAVNSIQSFTASVAVSGDPNLAAGIFVRGLFAAPIVQQPSTAPGFVSTDAVSATQFGMAADYGSVALLAHNYLLGQEFFQVRVGKILSLVFGDGHVKTYRVKQILHYQALSPSSPYSDFLDLDDPNGTRISVETLFYKVYTQNGTLVLQTCIEANGNSSWGRLFVIAVPENLVAIKQNVRSGIQRSQAIQ
jgi:hypothetical protein